MQLIDAIFLVSQMSENAVICAREPFVWGSEAVIAQLTDDYGVPEDVKAQGYAYFLEKEGVVELLEMISGKRASRETKAEFVCHYATHDAYPSWLEDLPNESNPNAKP